MQARIVLSAALVALLAAGQASAAPKKPKKAAPPPATRVEPDQSYLYLSPGSAEPGGAPDYVTRGSARFNQPWAGTVYDTLGDWPPGR